MSKEKATYKLSDVPKRKAFSWKKEKGNIVIVTPNTVKVFLNPKLAMVWEKINDVYSIDDICSKLVSEGSIDSNFVVSAIKNFYDNDLISFEDYLWSSD